MKTYCTYKNELHELISVRERSEQEMKERIILNKFGVMLSDSVGRFIATDLVSCSEFIQK